MKTSHRRLASFRARVARAAAPRRHVIVLVILLAVLGAGAPLAQAPAAASDAVASPVALDILVVKLANGTLREYARLSRPKQLFWAAFAVEVAKVRRAALSRLIRSSPRDAIALSLSPQQRLGLPRPIVSLLELRIHAVGDLVESITESAPMKGQPPGPSITSWSATTAGRTREAHVYGLREGHQTQYASPLHGIAIGNVMAVDESPLYLYDQLEKLRLGFQPNQIVATSGGPPIPLPDLVAFDKLRETLLQEILRFGPYTLDKILPIGDPHPWTTGLKRVLVIRADFGDNPGTLYSDAEIHAGFDAARTFYEGNSQLHTSLAWTFLPEVLRLPFTAASYAGRGEDASHRAIRDDAANAARAYDAAMGGTGMYDPDDYDRYVVLTPQVLMIPKARGDLTGKGVVFTGTSFFWEVLAHELGHTYGFKHSNFWFVPVGADPIGPGSFFEYGDPWDMMGGPPLDMTELHPHLRHFNAFFKWLAGWLEFPSFRDVTAGGSFRLYRHDAADAAGLRSIWIEADADKYYWLDVRRNFWWNTSMSVGVEVRRVTRTGSPYGQVELLDMDSTLGTSIDHSLTRARVFEDPANDIRITVTGSGADGVGQYADVLIER